MSRHDDRAEAPGELGARYYSILCLAGLGLLLLGLLLYWEPVPRLAPQRLGLRALFPVLVGLMGLLLRWRSAGPLLLLALGGLLLVPWVEVRFTGGDLAMANTLQTESDLLIGVGVLLYLAGFYRLQGLEVAVFPVDPRDKKQSAAPDRAAARAAQPVCRSPQLVTSWEVAQLVMTVPVWLALGLFCWKVLPRDWGHYGLGPGFWQKAVVTWGLALVLLGAAAFLRYLGGLRQTPEEARLFLLDTAWQETCREQRSISRWLVLRKRKTER